MRYSSIIGLGFYGIQLTKEQYESVDAHFLSCVHHLRRFEQSRSQFHQTYFWQHLKALMAIVQSGDFRESIDLSERGMNLKSSWTPQFMEFDDPSQSSYYPDPEMFSMMDWPDERYLIGQSFPYDILLSAPIAASKISLQIEAQSS